MHLFAGAGGGILADLLLGHQPVCAVEWNEYCQQVLSARQKDGLLPWFPIFADVQQFDGRPWRGIVDVVSGGFPCQDISAAGKGAGIEGERSGMWKHMARIIREVRPRFVFVENSPMLVSRGLGTVLGDLAQMGFDARWGVLGSVDVGLATNRDRLWIVASAISDRLERNRKNRTPGEMLAGQRLSASEKASDVLRSHLQRTDASDVHRIPNGISSRVDRLKATGNAQVPALAARAWRILTS